MMKYDELWTEPKCEENQKEIWWNLMEHNSENLIKSKESLTKFEVNNNLMKNSWNLEYT